MRIVGILKNEELKTKLCKQIKLKSSTKLKKLANLNEQN